MKNSIVINPAVRKSSAASISAEIIEEYNRQNNIEADVSCSISEGTLLCGKYRVQSQLEVSSGEADLFLCSDESCEYVAKVYRRKFSVKPEALDSLRKIDFPYVAHLYETGVFNGHYVEILPYYENGNLQGKTFTESALVKKIIPNINEGLRAIHEAGIIHGNLKPSNIMLNSDGETVSIIDFGLSSIISCGAASPATKSGITPEYSAPETFKNLFLPASDYYSLGITLFELFCGYTPYANMQPEEIAQFASAQKIPYPEEMPVLLQDFISALTYNNISSRGNMNNPNHRWTYNEVIMWLDGKPLVIPGKVNGKIKHGAMPVFRFLGKDFTEPTQLVTAFAKNWEEAKKLLFRGVITAHFRTWNQESARKCQAAEEEAGRENGRDDVVFWKLLYQINPGLKAFYWMGQTYESLPAFGRNVLEKLWDNDSSQYPYYDSILSEKLLSQYALMTAPKNERLKKVAEAIEASYELGKNNGTDMQRTYYLMAYLLSGQKLLLLDGKQIRTVGELVSHMKSVFGGIL